MRECCVDPREAMSQGIRACQARLRRGVRGSSPEGAGRATWADAGDIIPPMCTISTTRSLQMCFVATMPMTVFIYTMIIIHTKEKISVRTHGLILEAKSVALSEPHLGPISHHQNLYFSTLTTPMLFYHFYADALLLCSFAHLSDRYP